MVRAAVARVTATRRSNMAGVSYTSKPMRVRHVDRKFQCAKAYVRHLFPAPGTGTGPGDHVAVVVDLVTVRTGQSRFDYGVTVSVCQLDRGPLGVGQVT